MTLRYYSSVAQPTTLANNITAATTTIQVAAAVGFPTSTPYTLALDYGTSLEELVSVTSAAGTTLQVTRGIGGTSAQPHSIGAAVRHVSYSQDFADSRAHEEASTSVHGVTEVVGTTETQTLTNKTLTAPTINSPTIGSATLNGGTQAVSNGPSAVALTVKSHASQNSGIPTLAVNNMAGATKFMVDREAHLQIYHTDTDSAIKLKSDVSTSPGTIVLEVYDESDAVVMDIDNNGTITTSPPGSVDGVAVITGASYTGEPFRYTKDSVDLWTINNDGSISTPSDLFLGGQIFAANFTAAGTDWTPVFEASGGGFSLGNGTVGGRYSKFGKMVFVEGWLIRGTTTGFGAGDVRCTLPFAANLTSSHQYILSAMLYDATANLPYAGSGIIFNPGAGTRVEFCSFKAGAAVRVSGASANPFAWAGNTGAAIRFTGVYEEA